ncbi:heat shock protein 30 [Fomitopsis betulina]|nr:heat shock protein 30 [Fomitopsis betulina]
MAGNQAIHVNPPNAQEHISTNGSDWLWAAFSIQAFSFLAAFVALVARPRGTRLFHNIALVIMATSSVAYFSMASDLGATPIETEFRNEATRQVWYVRYIQWFINWPLLVLSCLLATGLSLSDILTTMFMAVLVVIAWLVGALVHTSYKWGYFVFGLFALIFVWFQLLVHAPQTNFASPTTISKPYWLGAAYLFFILLTYPICWGCSEGGNVITVTSEMIWYGILDICAGPGFFLLFFLNLRKIDYATFGFQSGKWVEGAPVASSEKPRV